MLGVERVRECGRELGRRKLLGEGGSPYGFEGELGLDGTRSRLLALRKETGGPPDCPKK